MTRSRDIGEVDAFRSTLGHADLPVIRDLVAATGVFSAAEIALALELAAERLERGAEWGYHFLIAERGGCVAGFACYGPIPATAGSYDLYWLVVAPEHHRSGLGRDLVQNVERSVRDAGGDRLFVETSSRACYAPAREFYLRCGFRHVAALPDYYGPGDDEMVYVKVLEAT